MSPVPPANPVLEKHRQQLLELGGEDADFVLTDSIEWGPDTNTEADELAPKPKPEKNDDPCTCSYNYEDENAVTCNDLSCVLFACQEECRSNCTVGDQCGNKRIQKRQWKELQIIDAGKKGKGLKVLEDVKKGDLVVEYVGKAVNRAYLPHLFRRYANERKLYIMALTADVYLDARKRGGIARYINHSCDPNCKVERWKVRGLLRAAVIANRDIPAGTELSFDYQWERKRGRAPTKCYCGSENCRGTLEVSRSMEEEALERKLSQHWKRPLIKRAGKEIVNRCIKVFSKEAQDYYPADVIQYDESQGKHLLMFRHDLEESWEDLKSEDWMVLDEEAEQFFIRKKASASTAPSSAGSNSLLKGLGNNGGAGGGGGILMQGQKSHANYVYTHTPIKDLLFQKHLIERCQRSCGVTIEATRFTMPADPPIVDASTDPEIAERLRMIQSSQDGTVWKLTINGADVPKARDILSKNVVYITNKEMGRASALVPDNNGNNMAIGPASGKATAMPNEELPEEHQLPSIEVVMPRVIVESLKRRLPMLRERFKSVKYDFVSSDSKSKQIAKLVVRGIEEDVQSARDLLWQQLNQSCEEHNAPKTASGVYVDLGFLAGSMSNSDFVMLSGYGKSPDLLASAFAVSSSIVDGSTTGPAIDLSQDAREDLSLRSPFFSSFESSQRCAIWVQSDFDKGRIDSSNRLINEATPDGPRNFYIGCAPSRVPDLWRLIESRMADISNGVRYLYLGPDRLYQPQLMQNGGEFFAIVNRATGARVEVDSMTSDHLRIDGSLPTDRTNSISPGERAAQAEELVRLQIELYRDNNIIHEKWIFGRDWALARKVALANATSDSSEGPVYPSSSSRLVMSRNNPFEGKYMANACLEIADVVSKLEMEKSVAAHASALLYRFGTVSSMRQAPETQFKIREVLVACVFLANKAQKKRKWKKLVTVLEAAYSVFYPGTEFDGSKEEVLVWQEKVVGAEAEIIERLDYDVFYQGFEWVLAAATDSVGMDRRKAKECLSLSLSGPVLASGADLWLTHGPEYIFAASAAFLDADYEGLCLSLSLIPIKVCRAAEIIASAVKATTFGERHLSHPIFKSGRKVLENKIPTIKIRCANLMSENDDAKRAKTKLSERDMRYQLIGKRHVVGRKYRMPTSFIQQYILPSIDGVMAESNCCIYMDRAEKGSRAEDSAFDVTLEGSWRSVALAAHALIRTVANAGGNAAFDRKPYEKKQSDVAMSFRNMQAKGQPGLLEMKKIETSDGWANTIHSEIFSKAGWGRKTGGKCCVPGRIKESDLRRGGLRWWVPPRYGPSSTGSICDMLLVDNGSDDLAGAIGHLSYLSQGDSTLFSMLTSGASSKLVAEGSVDRFVALSLNPWPSEKTASYEQGKAKKVDPIAKKVKKKKVVEVGFSPAALEEMQLLRQLHSLINSPQGHPNFYLPIAVTIQPSPKKTDTNSSSDGPKGFFDLKSIDEDIFSLTRSSLENEAMAQKELRRKSPHLVTPPMPFVLQRFVGKKKRLADDDQKVVSPKIFGCWCYDLLSALLHCHENDVVVRYFQMDQIVIDHSGVAKIGSLYRATVLSKEDKAANILSLARARKDKTDDDDDVRDPYSAPEMLLGSPLHTKAGDVWGLGCLLAHLLIGKPLCSAKDRESFLVGLYKLVGSPSSKNFPLAVKFPHYTKPIKKYPADVKKAIHHMAKDRMDIQDYAGAIDLISQMLQLDPEKRITAKGALQHEYMSKHVEDSISELFQDEFVEDWMALKLKLMDVSKTEEDEMVEKERGEKRKAMLVAASQAMAVPGGDEDDLYDMGDLLESDAKRPKI
jgi:serine/threonine protein kinase